jgi:hypothetical protein
MASPPPPSISRKSNERAAISVITRAEVLAGFDEEEAVALASQVLDCFACLILDKPIADRAAARAGSCPMRCRRRSPSITG